MPEVLGKRQLSLGTARLFLARPRAPSSPVTHSSGGAPCLTSSACFPPLAELLVQALLCSSGWLQQAGVPFRCDAHVAVGQRLQPADDVCRAELNSLTAHGGVSNRRQTSDKKTMIMMMQVPISMRTPCTVMLHGAVELNKLGSTFDTVIEHHKHGHQCCRPQCCHEDHSRNFSPSEMKPASRCHCAKRCRS